MLHLEEVGNKPDWAADELEHLDPNGPLLFARQLGYQSDVAQVLLLAVCWLELSPACTDLLVALVAVAVGIEGSAVEACPSAIADRLPVAVDYRVEVLQLDGHQACTCCTCSGAAAGPMGSAGIDSSALKHTLHSALVQLAVAVAAGLVVAACSSLLHVAALVHQEQATCSSQYGMSSVARTAL